MSNSHRRFGGHGAYRHRRSFKPNTKRPALRPGADAALKKIFGGIGAPEPQPFNPDPFQLKAVEVVLDSDCLVSAPTGAGKTWIALQAITRIHRQGGRAWYASPLKALTNAKMAEFSNHFGNGQVGILTGDRKENAGAPIIVGTTEILRNQLYDAMHKGEKINTDFVVLDEVHYLGDQDRGVVWEETIIYLPHRIPLLLLSATIGNDQQLADWMTHIRKRPCRVVRETKRPVPLHPIFLHPSGTLLPLLSKPGSQTKDKIFKKVNEYLTSKKAPRLGPPGKLPPFGELLAILRKYHLLPSIFFLKSRADCDYALQLCQENKSRDPDRNAARNRRLAELSEQFPHIRRHRQHWMVEHLAIGSHHSGQLPAWKLVLETLMSEGLLDAIFATSTVAAGVDFPARTVGFLNSDRFNGREFVPLDTTELLQMTGRAGRRGKDKIGFAMIVPGKYMDVRNVARLFKSAPAPIYSQIRINFSMCLNLLLSHTPKEVKNLLERSFAAFQFQSKTDSHGDTVQDFLWQAFLRHLEFLRVTGFVGPNNQLTEDGLWASKLRIDQPLLVAECLRQDLLPQSDPALLAAVMAAFVNEKETDEHLEKKHLPKQLTACIKKIVRGLRGFAKYMQVRGFDVRPIYYKPALTVWAWASGQPWEKVVQNSQMAEGDLAMLILRTADNLRHLAWLKQTFAQMSANARQAVELILRDPVMTQYSESAPVKEKTKDPNN
ncbi:MAG: DEAD/DEAH box helicase [Desulfobacteraceae bacterium]|nr:DEAD/DEAH box helicase [Desulfobacteraceae bacterium]